MTKPNRQEYNYVPIAGARIYYRRADPRSPVEMVISHGGSDDYIVYQLTRAQVRANCRELTAYEFQFPDEFGE